MWRTKIIAIAKRYEKTTTIANKHIHKKKSSLEMSKIGCTSCAAQSTAKMKTTSPKLKEMLGFIRIPFRIIFFRKVFFNGFHYFLKIL